MSYVGPDGKQYVAVFVGGAAYSAIESKGDYIIAYALPD